MASDRDNIIFEKTSFLQGGNSPFIKDLYLQYLKNPAAIPESWREFFDGLQDNQNTIISIKGPNKDTRVLKKEKILGLWFNTKKVIYKKITSLFFITSSALGCQHLITTKHLYSSLKLL